MQSRYTNLETATESGVLYLVPNENGKGKRVIRKPHPPPTSIPMDENFDAYTLETREPVTEAETVQGRPTSWAPTSPPLDEDFDAWTYTNTAGPVTGTGTLYEEEYHADSEDAEDERDGELVAGDERSESRRRRNRPLRRRKRLGRSGPLTVSASRDSDNEGPPNGYEATTARHHNGVRAQYDDGAGPSHHYPPAENHRPPQEATERSLSMIPSSSKIVANGHPDTGQGHYKSQARSIMISGNGKHKSGTRNRKRNDHTRQTVSRRGPVAHDFEVVNSRVLEEGPERTVTISTWRERVANEARRSEVEMSVYYLNADDYVMDPEPEHEREPFRASLNSLTRPKKEKGKQDLLRDGWTRSKPEYYRSSSPLRVYTPWPSGTKEPTAESSSSSKSTVKKRDSTRHSYSEWRRRDYVEPRTSTPIQHQREPNAIHSVHTAAQSLGNDEAGANGSGHEHSDSSISSMHVASTPALEALLSSCEPSLLYLAPILVELGIRTKEHMKAVGKLREETRNREVREEALKRGMTIMEWAILLDKLQQNG